jgi:hypothetical protein
MILGAQPSKLPFVELMQTRQVVWGFDFMGNEHIQVLQAKMLALDIPPTGEFPQTGGDWITTIPERSAKRRL